MPDNGGEEYRAVVARAIKTMYSQDLRKTTFLIAVEENDIIGCAAFTEESFAPDVWGLSAVNVRTDKRGQGIATNLLKTCLAEISKRTGKSFTALLCTMPGQSVLYDRLGFEKSGIAHDGGWLMTKICK